MLEQVALIYKLNNGLVSRALDGLAEDEVWQSPPGGGNPLAWVLGHVTEYRYLLLGLMGHPLPLEWGERVFARGSARRERGAYPDRRAIEGCWKATHTAMRDAFASVTADQLSAPARMELPGVKTIADQIAFGAFHESYHVGQMG